MMRCPSCLDETTYQGNPFRPFCSERCKLIDLGKWASGVYRLPSPETAPAEFPESAMDGRNEE